MRVQVTSYFGTKLWNVFVLLNGTYKYRKKDELEDIEYQAREGFCREDCADNGNFQDLSSAIGLEKTYWFISSSFVWKWLHYDQQRLVGTKICIHYSHVTEEIYGFSNNFCNWKARENKQKFTGFAQDLFGFNFYFVLKGVKLSV